MNCNNLEPALRVRLEELHTLAPGSIGDQMELRLVDCDPEAGIYRMRCATQHWMRNIAGTLHGGMCATLADQAMGCVAYCAKPGPGIAPTVEMNVSYHRPLIPGQDVLVNVYLMSVTRNLMHLRAELFVANEPDRLCLSTTGVYFYKEQSHECAH